MHGAIVVSKSIASADCFNKGSLISCPHTNEIYHDKYLLNTAWLMFFNKLDWQDLRNWWKQEFEARPNGHQVTMVQLGTTSLERNSALY